MTPRPAAAMLILLSLVAIVAGTGCGRQSMTSPTAFQGGGETNPSTDSIPLPPPPPPPPSVSPLVYLGADSVQAGGTLTQHWQLTNESDQTFVMNWTLASHPVWPGLPQSGSVSLLGREVRELTTTATVPDTAAAGVRWLRMTVTRPTGLPDASVDGPFMILP